MSLINELLHRPIDPRYPRSPASPPRRRRRAERPTGTLLLVSALVIGLLFGISYLDRRQTDRSAARAELSTSRVDGSRSRRTPPGQRAAGGGCAGREQIVGTAPGALRDDQRLTVSVGALRNAGRGCR